MALPFVIPTPATTGTMEHRECVPTVDVVEMELIESTGILVCDYVGYTYLSSIGMIATPASDDLRDVATLNYYFLMRAYVLSRGGEDQELTREQISLLVSILALAQQIPEQKQAIYKAFIIAEFWNHLEPKTRPSRLALRGNLQVYAAESEIDSLSAARCFVRHDIPSLARADVLASKHFQACD